MNQVDEVTDKTINEGGILAKLYFDMHGKDKDGLQLLLTDLVSEKLLKASGVVYAYGSIEEPIELEPGLYSTMAIVTTLFKDLKSLLMVAFTFSPAGIEVLRPEKIYELPISKIHDIVLDLSSISLSYSEFILKNVLSKEDYEKIEKEMELRKKSIKEFLSPKDDSFKTSS